MAEFYLTGCPKTSSSRDAPYVTVACAEVNQESGAVLWAKMEAV